MRKVNFNLLGMINERYRNYIVVLFAIIFIFSSVLTILTIRQPLQIQEKEIVNRIEERTSFDYSAVVKPSTLYPNGGRIVSDTVVFNNLTEDFIININSEINTYEPVRVEAIKEVMYYLIADGLWKEEFVLSGQQSVKLNGLKNELMNEEVHLSLNEINNFITRVEEETLVKPNYKLIVIPKIIGNVFDNNNNVIYKIDNQLEIPFDLTNEYISYAGEESDKEFLNVKTIEETKIIPQHFNFLGINLNVVGARLIFGITTLVILTFILIYFADLVKKKKRKNITETYIFDIRPYLKLNNDDWPQP